MFKIIILTEAEEDTRASLIWYKLRSPVAAANFLDELTNCYEEVLKSPTSFRRVRGRIKEARLVRFPFKIDFEVVGDEVLILRVYHLRRNPRKRFSKRR